MPRRKRAVVLVLSAALLAASGCSRFTFIRPSAKTVDFHAGGTTDYDVHDDARTRERIDEQDSLQLAAQRLQAGDVDSAETEARKVLRKQPDSVGATTLLAVIAQRRGDRENAGKLYRKAAELAPGDGATQNNYGTWLCANGYPAESLVWFDRALANRSYGTPAAALANAGGCAFDSGQYERADRDLRKALQLEPNNAFALESMARSEYRAGRYFEARAFTERRLAAAPANANVLKLAQDIEMRLGDANAASRYAQRLRAEFPDAATATPGEPSKP